ncbi:metal ABC transporter solute-binding protein, Zn/Mn family [Sunxiuqinia sp. sy24]|uniref:metal ABC transporter solute-binding protein, Zn/Mn family n=1 Tax=Sunxiuqinia sp. sy24 TaxID=3461495 RepID=UPI004046302D
MKRLVLIALVFLGACSTPKTSDKNLLTVSILPQKYFVEKIAGDLVEVQVLVPPGASPSTYSLLPSQMKDLSRSLAWLRIGKIGFEDAWHEKIEQGNPHLKVVDTSADADWIADEIEQHGDHVHAHGVDPHIWMSPAEARKIAALTHKALVSLFPDEASSFKQNYELFLTEIDLLDEQLLSQFDGLKSRKFLIFHPALTYLARDYDLEQISLELEGKEPSAKYMSQLVKHARDVGIRVVFIQKEFDQENARQLADELQGEVVQLDPLNENWEQELRNIADKLVDASK